MPWRTRSSCEGRNEPWSSPAWRTTRRAVRWDRRCVGGRRPAPYSSESRLSWSELYPTRLPAERRGPIAEIFSTSADAISARSIRDGPHGFGRPGPGLRAIDEPELSDPYPSDREPDPVPLHGCRRPLQPG